MKANRREKNKRERNRETAISNEENIKIIRILPPQQTKIQAMNTQLKNM